MGPDGEGSSYSSSPRADGRKASNPSSPRLPLPRRSFPDMILEAIDALKDDNASNEWSILGFIKGKYGASLPPKHASLVPSHLATMISTGEVVLHQNNYYRPVANAVAVKRGRRRRRKRKGKGPAVPMTGLPVTPSEAFVLPPASGGATDANATNASLGSSTPGPLAHPPYPQMIVEALLVLNNENGSDSMAIARCIESKYGSKLKATHTTFVMAHLSLMKASGAVLSVPPLPKANPPVDPQPGTEST